MTFELKEPVLIIGIGGVGSKLAAEAKESLNADCLLMSQDKSDFRPCCVSLQIETGSVVNPTFQLIRGSAARQAENIREKIGHYSTVLLVANLAGKAGSGIAPIVSKICKEENQNLISFVIMPFKFEKERIFCSGISLKRLRGDSKCTIVLDNDAILDSNPDLTPAQCHKISNEAILKIISSLGSSEILDETNIISTSKDVENVETSFKDSIRMLYEDAPPTSIKRSILYVLGGNNVPIGMLDSLTNMASGVFNNDNASINTSISPSDKSKVVMLSSVQGQTIFDKYDPLSIIPEENTLDWKEPDCSIDCEIDLYQLE